MNLREASNSTEILSSLYTFNREAGTRRAESKRIILSTRFWIHDEQSGGFAPNKFAAYAEMTFDLHNLYSEAHRKKKLSAFAGPLARKAIESILKPRKYIPQPELHQPLRDWVSNLLGSDPLSTKQEAKWQFITIGTPDASSPIAYDLAESPLRQECTTYRILRDTALARRIKGLHNHECQICGHVIVFSDGTRYSEAHHIRPLGMPHNGHDVMGNIICVCPNHHAELDYGARSLNPRELRLATGHVIGEEYVRYHNDNIHGK